MAKQTQPFREPGTVGLIGGSGKMGAMFGPLFERDGLQVLVAGRTTELTYERLVELADVVIVTVPVKETVALIRRIAPRLRAGQLFSDFTSVKGEPVAAMLSGGASVIGCHPVFGPMADLRGQKVVLCPERPGPFLAWYREFFERHGMRVIEMTPAAHDEAMAFIQGLTHFLNISFARTLQTRGADLEALLEVCSPVYRMFFAALCRILSGDRHLYSQIQVSNPGSVPIVAEFLQNGADLLDRVTRNDLEGVNRVFREAAEYLGDFKDEARRESDFLIAELGRFLRDQTPGGG